MPTKTTAVVVWSPLGCPPPIVLVTLHDEPFAVAQRAPSHATGTGATASAQASSSPQFVALSPLYAEPLLFEASALPPSLAASCPASCARARWDIASDVATTVTKRDRAGMRVALAQTLPGKPAIMTRSSLVPNLVAAIGGVSMMVLASVARADPPAPADIPVDVVVPEAVPPRRVIAVEWNPLSLFTIGKLSANVVIVPINHHALILSPFYAWTTTQPIYTYDDQGNATQLPQQKFSGFGCEIGYRYYTGDSGPRGFFVGPSLILASMTAAAQNGNHTPYTDYGVAVDIGYEMILADSVALSLGAGAQYATPDKSIPDQQFPADIYANSRVFPRALASLGWAF